MATIYEDRNGTIPLGNPFNANAAPFAADGYVFFHASAGAYRITVTSGSYTQTLRYVGISLTQEQEPPPVGTSWTFDDAISNSDPGAGLFRLNNADPASATEIYVSTQDRDNVEQGGWLNTFDDGGEAAERGILTLRSVDNSAVLVARVTGAITANGSPVTYYSIPITVLSTSGVETYVAEAVFGFIFTRSGADGADGIGAGDVIGPDGGVAQGQFAIYADATGKEITGGEDAESPANPLSLGTAANVHAAAAGRILQAGHLRDAAAPVALVDAATVALDWTAGINFTLTMTANRTLGNPSNGIPGTTRTVLVEGNATSPPTDRTLSFGNQYGGDLPTLTDVNDTQKYLLTIYCKSASQFLVTSINGSDA